MSAGSDSRWESRATVENEGQLDVDEGTDLVVYTGQSLSSLKVLLLVRLELLLMLHLSLDEGLLLSRVHSRRTMEGVGTSGRLRRGSRL